MILKNNLFSFKNFTREDYSNCRYVITHLGENQKDIEDELLKLEEENGIRSSNLLKALQTIYEVKNIKEFLLLKEINYKYLIINKKKEDEITGYFHTKEDALKSLKRRKSENFEYIFNCEQPTESETNKLIPPTTKQLQLINTLIKKNNCPQFTGKTKKDAIYYIKQNITKINEKNEREKSIDYRLKHKPSQKQLDLIKELEQEHGKFKGTTMLDAHNYIYKAIN